MAVTGTGAGLEGIIAAESSICYIDGQEGILSYQGFNIHTLADHATFEEVIFLLWNGKLPNWTSCNAGPKNLPKNPAVGGTPANENNAMVNTQERTGLVL